MVLIELFLPRLDPDGQPFGREAYVRVRDELTGKFGGVTAYVRAPASGAWEDHEGQVRNDEMLLFEVMADAVDHGWWAHYRDELERRFSQDEILVRATAVERL